MRCIDEHRDRFGGVEPICRVLTEHGCSIDPSAYYRAARDGELKDLITRVHRENIAVSIGTVGDALDNALIESTIGLYEPS